MTSESKTVVEILDELERMEKAATAVPWRWLKDGDPPLGLTHDDMETVAAARNHLPLLLALARLAVEAEDMLWPDNERAAAWLSRFSALESGARKGETP